MQSSCKNRKCINGTPPAKHKKIVASPARQFGHLSFEEINNLLSWLKQKVHELKHLLDHTTRLWTGHAEMVLFQGIRIQHLTMIAPFIYRMLQKHNISLLPSMKSTSFYSFFATSIEIRCLPFRFEHNKIKANSYLNYYFKLQDGYKSKAVPLRHPQFSKKSNKSYICWHFRKWENALKVPGLYSRLYVLLGWAVAQIQRKVAVHNSAAWLARSFLVREWFSQNLLSARCKCIFKLYCYYTYPYPLTNATYTRLLRSRSS